MKRLIKAVGRETNHEIGRTARFWGVKATGELSAEELHIIEGKQNIEEKSEDLIEIKKKQALKQVVLPEIAE